MKVIAAFILPVETEDDTPFVDLYGLMDTVDLPEEFEGCEEVKIIVTMSKASEE